MAVRSDVSESLDALGQIPGTMLFRGPIFWEAFLIGTPGQVLTVSPANALQWVTLPPAITADSASINTFQNTASVPYVNLATVGPSVTILTGTTALVTIDCTLLPTAANTNKNGVISFAVSGATTIAAADGNGCFASTPNVAFGNSLSRTVKISGLTPGVNTFTMKYRVDGSTFSFGNRSITVQRL